MNSCGQAAQRSNAHLKDRIAGPRSIPWRTILFRVIAILVLCGSLAIGASAQVTVLVERGASPYRQTAQGFKESFSDAIDPEEIEIDETGQLSRDLVEQLRANPPQLVVTIGTRAARTAAERLPNLPILYCLPLRPREAQLTGANIGGMVLDIPLQRQMEGIRKLLPNLRRLGVVYDELTSGSQLKQARQAGLELIPRNARTPQEAERQIRDLFTNVLGPGDAFLLLWDPVAANPATFRILVELSLKNKVALIVPARPFVEAGALVSVGANYEQVGRQLAQMAHEILAGNTRAGKFQAVAPPDVTITINGEVARQLNIPIPADFRADILGPIQGAPVP
jgi:putative ABC transport system substrate-binding protein